MPRGITKSKVEKVADAKTAAARRTRKSKMDVTQADKAGASKKVVEFSKVDVLNVINTVTPPSDTVLARCVFPNVGRLRVLMDMLKDMVIDVDLYMTPDKMSILCNQSVNSIISVDVKTDQFLHYEVNKKGDSDMVCIRLATSTLFKVLKSIYACDCLYMVVDSSVGNSVKMMPLSKLLDINAYTREFSIPYPTSPTVITNNLTTPDYEWVIKYRNNKMLKLFKEVASIGKSVKITFTSDKMILYNTNILADQVISSDLRDIITRITPPETTDSAPGSAVDNIDEDSDKDSMFGDGVEDVDYGNVGISPLHRRANDVDANDIIFDGEYEVAPILAFYKSKQLDDFTYVYISKNNPIRFCISSKDYNIDMYLLDSRHKS